MTDAGWLLVGLVLGMVVTVALIEWHDGHARRVAARHTRAGDPR